MVLTRCGSLQLMTAHVYLWAAQVDAQLKCVCNVPVIATEIDMMDCEVNMTGEILYLVIGPQVPIR